MVIAGAGFGCAGDELAESDANGVADGGMEGAEPSERPNSNCGNGQVDDREECDDGNATDHDQCTSACALPSCGDGIVHAAIGEACDDGNLEPGDGCSPSCTPRGTKILDHTSGWFSYGHAVVVDSNDQLIVLARDDDDESQVAMLDQFFDAEWETSALAGNPLGLAVGSNDEILVGGKLDDQAKAQRLSHKEGAELWTEGVPYVNSTFASVAASGHHMVAAGYYGPMFKEKGVLARHHPSTGTLLNKVDWELGPLTLLTVNRQGWIWAIDNDEDAELVVYNAYDQLQHQEGLASRTWVDMAVDQNHHVYMVATGPGHDSLEVWKYLGDDTYAWPPVEVLDANASAMALTPNGVVIVAGHTTDESSGLLVWVDGETGELLHEIEVGSGEDWGAYEVFNDVALAPSGEFAVAVGARGPAWNDTSMWIYEFEL